MNTILSNINNCIDKYEELLSQGQHRADLYLRLVRYYRRKRLYEQELKAIVKIAELYRHDKRLSEFYNDRRVKARLLMEKRLVHLNEAMGN